jgi:mono/diheme cytochrome c family protein
VREVVNSSRATAREVSTPETALTEIPEFLLKRSKDRRAALSGQEPAADAPAAGASTSSQAVEAAPAAAAAQAAPVATAAAPAAPYVAAAKTRTRIPRWAMPVVALLPIWGVLYAVTLEAKPAGASGPIAVGKTLYEANCLGCHGVAAGGGAGRQLSNGEVNKTFLTAEEQVAFVQSGSKVYDAKPYGNPDRPGGAHQGGSYAKGQYMPSFSAVLTQEQIASIVCYERIEFFGSPTADNSKYAPAADYVDQCNGKTALTSATAKPGAATTTAAGSSASTTAKP